MKEMISMVVVLTFLSVFSGGSLSYLRDITKDRIEKQQLKFVKGPAVMSVLTNTSTGRTGAMIASHFSRRGHDVTLLRARTAQSADGVWVRWIWTMPCRIVM